MAGRERIYFEDSAIIAEAASWLERARRGSHADRAAFRIWLREKPEHVAAMDVVERAWRHAPAAARAAGLKPSPQPRPQLMPAMPRWLFPALGSIAAATAVATAAVLVWTGNVHNRVFAAPADHTIVATLDDGSHAWLTPGSTITVRSTPLERAVALEGEAVFDVRHDQRPFIVTAGATQVTDLGTVFSVAHNRDETLVVLARGAIAVQDRASGSTIATPKPGEQVDIRGDVATTAPIDAEAALAWREGRIVARDMPLSKVVERFHALGGPRIRIADPAVGAIRIDGTYRIGDVRPFLDAVAALHPVTWHRLEDGYEVRSRR